MNRLSMSSPTGPLTLTEEDQHITRLEWEDGHADHSPLLSEARAQLQAYFTGSRQEFDLPLRVNGSSFQRTVCDAMSKIPFGETVTYGDLARALSVPAQAIGQACGGNPIPIIIPCHRVLGANGLGGFSGAGGVETKVWLLKHEGAGSLLL